MGEGIQMARDDYIRFAREIRDEVERCELRGAILRGQGGASDFLQQELVVLGVSNMQFSDGQVVEGRWYDVDMNDMSKYLGSFE